MRPSGKMRIISIIAGPGLTAFKNEVITEVSGTVGLVGSPDISTEIGLF